MNQRTPVLSSHPSVPPTPNGEADHAPQDEAINASPALETQLSRSNQTSDQNEDEEDKAGSDWDDEESGDDYEKSETDRKKRKMTSGKFSPEQEDLDAEDEGEFEAEFVSQPR